MQSLDCSAIVLETTGLSPLIDIDAITEGTLERSQKCVHVIGSEQAEERVCQCTEQLRNG